MEDARDDDGGRGQQRAHPQTHGEPADRSDFPVQQGDVQHATAIATITVPPCVRPGQT